MKQYRCSVVKLVLIISNLYFIVIYELLKNPGHGYPGRMRSLDRIPPVPTVFAFKGTPKLSMLRGW